MKSFNEHLTEAFIDPYATALVATTGPNKGKWNVWVGHETLKAGSVRQSVLVARNQTRDQAKKLRQKLNSDKAAMKKALAHQLTQPKKKVAESLDEAAPSYIGGGANQKAMQNLLKAAAPHNLDKLFQLEQAIDKLLKQKIDISGISRETKKLALKARVSIKTTRTIASKLYDAAEKASYQYSRGKKGVNEALIARNRRPEWKTSKNRQEYEAVVKQLKNLMRVQNPGAEKKRAELFKKKAALEKSARAEANK